MSLVPETVTLIHDGFEVRLPGRRLGSNSLWILVFVPVWWGVAAAMASLVPDWFWNEPDGAVILLGVFGVMGWAPGWFALDRAWSAGTHRVLRVDGASIGLDGETYVRGDLTSATIVSGRLQLKGPEVWVYAPLQCDAATGRWLTEQFARLDADLDAREGVEPADMVALRAHEEG